MNYRHAFHAGNFADCMKHALLVWLLRALAAKEKPFRVLDTHAGIGSYDLSAASEADASDCDPVLALTRWPGALACPRHSARPFATVELAGPTPRWICDQRLDPWARYH